MKSNPRQSKCAACGVDIPSVCYQIHSDGFTAGPIVDLCDRCGASCASNCAELWKSIAARRKAGNMADNLSAGRFTSKVLERWSAENQAEEHWATFAGFDKCLNSCEDDELVAVIDDWGALERAALFAFVANLLNKEFHLAVASALANVRLNLNDVFSVELTHVGRNMLAASDMAGAWHEKLGRLSGLLWQFMNTFGPSMIMGSFTTSFVDNAMIAEAGT